MNVCAWSRIRCILHSLIYSKYFILKFDSLLEIQCYMSSIWMTNFVVVVGSIWSWLMNRFENRTASVNVCVWVSVLPSLFTSHSNELLAIHILFTRKVACNFDYIIFYLDIFYHLWLRLQFNDAVVIVGWCGRNAIGVFMV